MLKSSSYDIIIAGAGCAGLSLLVRLLKSGHFNDQKILLIDKERKSSNDRTWCFWERESGFFESIIHKRWNKISFLSDQFSTTADISPYEYKMIRGIDFYKYCFAEIEMHSNVEVIYGELSNWTCEKRKVTMEFDGKQIEITNSSAIQFFNSIYVPKKEENGSVRMLQHFKGWVIETPGSTFDPSSAIIMDFRVPQEDGTTFGYLLPISETQALVEYTLFSRTLLTPVQYDIGLKEYIRHTLGITEYTIKDEEFGVIPMTNEKFQFEHNNAWNIGTAGGQTKASSGYTFQFIQRQSQEIVDCLVEGRSLRNIAGTAKRFRFYDNTLLHILYHNQYPGKEIFTRLFKKNKPQQVLGFLDNQSSLGEELRIISTLPTWPFFKAALKQI